MPTCLSVFQHSSRKSILLTLLILLFPLFFFGQTLTGLWTGALSNDSTTVRKDQSFEIALTEYRGKVYGYSRSEFIVDDTLYYVVKRVKGTIEGDICEVNDDEIIAYNFRGKLDKGIKVTSTFHRNKQDSTWYLAGTWKTNATKKYYSVTGKVDLSEEKDLAASKIFPHLEELKLADEVAFYKERKEAPSIARMVKPEKIKTEYSTKAIPIPDNSDMAIAKPNLQRAEATVPAVNKENEAIITPVEAKQAESESSDTENSEQSAVNKKDNIAAIEVPRTENKNIPPSTVNISTPKPDRARAENVAPVIIASNTTANTVGNTGSETRETADATKKQGNNSPVKNNEQPQLASAKTVPLNNATQANVGNPVSKGNNNTDRADNKTTVNKDIASKQPVKNGNNASTNTIADKKATPAGTAKQDIAAATTPSQQNNTAAGNTVNDKKETDTRPLVAAAVPEIKKPDIDLLAKAAEIGGRKSVFSQIVGFKSDSLELALYDNGEIDGDTVSIYLNGEVIMSKQGLKASAIKKTIYITPGNEDFTLVLFAENLGSYPPNTGLLVVHDGNDVYNLRFSSDFQKNAGIVFRRKK